MLTTNTQLSSEIIARYTTFVSSISAEAEMLLLKNQGEGQPATVEHAIRQSVRNIWQIHNAIQQNNILNLNLSLEFVGGQLSTALENAAQAEQRAQIMTQRHCELLRETTRITLDRDKTILRLQEQLVTLTEPGQALAPAETAPAHHAATLPPIPSGRALLHFLERQAEVQDILPALLSHPPALLQADSGAKTTPGSIEAPSLEAAPPQQPPRDATSPRQPETPAQAAEPGNLTERVNEPYHRSAHPAQPQEVPVIQAQMIHPEQQEQPPAEGGRFAPLPPRRELPGYERQMREREPQPSGEETGTPVPPSTPDRLAFSIRGENEPESYRTLQTPPADTLHYPQQLPQKGEEGTAHSPGDMVHPQGERAAQSGEVEKAIPQTPQATPSLPRPAEESSQVQDTADSRLPAAHRPADGVTPTGEPWPSPAPPPMVHLPVPEGEAASGTVTSSAESTPARPDPVTPARTVYRPKEREETAPAQPAAEARPPQTPMGLWHQPTLSRESVQSPGEEKSRQPSAPPSPAPREHLERGQGEASAISTAPLIPPRRMLSVTNSRSAQGSPASYRMTMAHGARQPQGSPAPTTHLPAGESASPRTGEFIPAARTPMRAAASEEPRTLPGFTPVSTQYRKEQEAPRQDSAPEPFYKDIETIYRTKKRSEVTSETVTTHVNTATNAPGQNKAASQIPLEQISAAVMRQINVKRLADQVYRDISERLRTERMKRGL